VTIDIGTGDGRAVLEAAAREPATLFLGVDASAAGMVEASRRAAGPARKGGLPNARFILAAAEAPPEALAGAADLVTVRFPWGSLLRGCAGLDTTVAEGVASLVAPGGVLELLLAPSPRDGLEGVPTEPRAIVNATRYAFESHGLDLRAGRLATSAEIGGSGSTWAKRLAAGLRNGNRGVDADRSVTLVRFVRRRHR
jgi:16S rRNA (adenine(1408)-N(1))-methyltransferase